MKIAVLLGRGVEGCGVTQCAVQLQKVTGATIFATSDHKWPRAKGIEFPHTLFKAADLSACQDVQRQLAEMDLVVVYSVPSISHPVECQDNFVTLVENLNVRKVLINVDHKNASIIRNAKLKEICQAMDVLMTHSLDNDFCRWAKKNDVTTNIVKMGLGFDFDGHRAKYWKPIEQQNDMVIRWIGRSTGWKGPDIILDLADEYLHERGFITILEGLEASIGYPFVLYRDVKKLAGRRKVMNYFRPEKGLDNVEKFNKSMHGQEKVGVGSYLYPPYVNTECMERMSLSAFGSDLYHLPAQMYGNNIENCHAEVIASGAIPIFHKHFGDNVVHAKQGDAISQCKNTGTILLDTTNFAEVTEQLEKLTKDRGLRDEWREMAFSFWKQHANADEIVKEILELAFVKSDTKNQSRQASLLQY